MLNVSNFNITPACCVCNDFVRKLNGINIQRACFIYFFLCMHTSYDMTFFPFIYERIKFLFPFAMTIFFSPGTYRIIFSVIKKMLIPISKQFFWFRQTHWRKTWLHFHFYFLVISFRINYNCWFLLRYYHDIKLRNNLMSYSGYSVIAIYIQSIMFKVQNCRSANKKANTLYFYFFIILYCLAYTIFLECFIKINIWISGWK